MAMAFIFGEMVIPTSCFSSYNGIEIGDKYEGEFKNSLKHGHGKEQFSNGDFYIGNYVNGAPDGYGEYYWTNGCQYKGFFLNGLRHGKGVWKKNAEGSDKYEGDWLNDKKCGHGIYKWSSGNVYKGNYFDDYRHGYGEMIWADGSVYRGQWERGMQNGEGELLVPGKPPKKGLFQNNVFLGELQTQGDDLNVSVNMSTEVKKPRRLSPLMHTPEEIDQSPEVAEKANEVSSDHKHHLNHTEDNAPKPEKKVTPRVSRGRSVTPAFVRLTAKTQRGASVGVTANNSPDDKGNAPEGGWLTPKEIAKWNVVKEKLMIDPKKFENLRDEKVIQKIRRYIHPKVWRYWPRETTVKGKSDIMAQKTTSAAYRTYNVN